MTPVPASRRAALALAAAAFVVGVARYATEIDDPWDGTLASTNATNFTGNIERAFRRNGYAAMKGIPHLFVAPTAGPTAFDMRYAHHPPLFRGFVHAATELFGFSERGLRLPPILCTALATALLAYLLSRRYGAGPAAVGALVVLASPMGWHYGWMPNYEAPLLLLSVAAIGWHAAFRTRSLFAYAPVYALFLAATHVDWAGYFIGPALWAFELRLPAAERRLGRTLALVPLGALSAASVVAHLAWGAGTTFGAALDEIYRTALSAAGGAAGLGAPEWTTAGWFARHGDYLRRLFAPAGVAALAWGAVRLFRGRRDADDDGPSFALALLVPAALNVLLFRRGSYVHEFWTFAALPFAAWAAADFARCVGRRPFVVPFLAAVVAGSLAAETARQRRAIEEQPNLTREIAADLNAFAGPDDALLTQADLGPIAFYLDAWVTAPLQPPFYTPETTLPAAAQLKRAGLIKTKRLVCVVPDRILEAGAPAPRSQAALIESLPALGAVRRFTNVELAQSHPHLAGFLGGSGMAVLVVE